MFKLIALAIAAASADPTWYLVGDTPTALLAIDIATLSPSGKNVSVVEAQIFKRTLDTEYGPVRRIDQVLTVDCLNGLVTPKTFVVRKLDGDIAASTPATDPKPFQSEQIKSLACNKKPLQVLTGPYHLETIFKTADQMSGN